MIKAQADPIDKVHGLYAKLAKYSPEQVSGLVDRVFSKYDQPFELLNVDDTTHKVRIQLRDGRKIELPL